MQEITTRERAFLRIGIVAAILITLWMLGLFNRTPLVVY